MNTQILSLGSAIWLLAGQAFAGEQGTNQWGAVICGVQLSLTSELVRTNAATNEPIPVILHFRNVSNVNITVVETSAVADTSFVAVLPSGRSLSRSKPDPKDVQIYRRITTVVKPSETVSISMDLRKFFELKEPGEYRLTAKREILVPSGKDQFKSCELISNELRLVIPKP